MAEIRDIKTIPLDRGGEATHGIMVAVNSDGDGVTLEFVEELAKKIVLHRLCSPPDTSALVVTVIGELDTEQFRENWARTLSGSHTFSGPLRFYLQQMSTAVLVHGKPDGTILQEVRLGLN